MEKENNRLDCQLSFSRLVVCVWFLGGEQSSCPGSATDARRPPIEPFVVRSTSTPLTATDSIASFISLSDEHAQKLAT